MSLRLFLMILARVVMVGILSAASGTSFPTARRTSYIVAKASPRGSFLSSAFALSFLHVSVESVLNFLAKIGFFVGFVVVVVLGVFFVVVSFVFGPLGVFLVSACTAILAFLSFISLLPEDDIQLPVSLSSSELSVDDCSDALSDSSEESSSDELGCPLLTGASQAVSYLYTSSSDSPDSSVARRFLCVVLVLFMLS